jgi:hypothetical protein
VGLEITGKIKSNFAVLFHITESDTAGNVAPPGHKVQYCITLKKTKVVLELY